MTENRLKKEETNLCINFFKNENTPIKERYTKKWITLINTLEKRKNRIFISEETK